MQMHNHQALSRINGREAFVLPDTADLFVSNLTQFARADPEKAGALEASARESVEFCYSISPNAAPERKCFIYADGMAIIPIHGALINRFGGSWGFVTGYQAIRRQMNAALEDEDVKLIVFDVDSPGGETAGCFELAEEIRASREIKPSISVVDSLSASAGYALASAATRMVATPSSKIGSIGVYIMHVDFTGALDQAGIQISYIEAPKGGMKTAGSAYRKMDKRTADYLQAFVDASYEEFVAMVAANRNLEDAVIRETEARVFRADEALALGLIDEVKTPSEAVSTFVAELADDEPSEEEDEEMTAPKTPAAPAAAAPAAGSEATSGAGAPAATMTQADIDAAVTADRQRMSAIKALPEAAKLPKLADQLATSGYTVEQADAVLKAGVADLPTAAPAPAGEGAAAPKPVDEKNHLEEAMAGSKHPEVGAGSGEGGSGAGGEQTDESIAAGIIASQQSATGRKLVEAK
jgi:signal peptide peptidase SppA